MVKSLNELPPGLESMYHHMLQRLDSRYCNDASLLLKYLNHFDYSRGSHNYAYRLPSALLIFLCRSAFLSPFSNTDMAVGRDYMVKILQSRFRGLLSLGISSSQDMNYHGLVGEIRSTVFLKIDYVHRTAQEFITKNGEKYGLKIAADDGSNVDRIAYNRAIIEGPLRYLETLQRCGFKPLSDWDSILGIYVLNDPKPPACQILYDLLSSMRQHLDDLDDPSKYLDRLSAIPLVMIDQNLLMRLRTCDASKSTDFDHHLEALGEVSHIANHGFRKYVLAMIATSGSYRAVDISYLSYMALLWPLYTQSAERDHHDWICELQSILRQLDNNTFYLERVWITFLTSVPQESTFVHADAYKMVVQAYKSADLPSAKLANLFLLDRWKFSQRQNVWQIAVTPALLLHPSIIGVSEQLDDSNEEASISGDSVDACIGYLHACLPSDTWPQDMQVVHYYDPWLQLDFPVSTEQSAFMLDRYPIRQPDPFESSRRRLKLRAVMLYNLARRSSLSHNVTWHEYVQRLEQVLEREDHDDVVAHTYGPCLVDSCPRCAGPDYLQRANDTLSFNEYFAHGTSAPCPRGSCHECMCLDRLSKDECPGREAGCRDPSTTCQRFKMDRREICSSTCEGCGCARKINTKWLRKVLHGNELDWHGWYDLLVDKYGLREKPLERQELDDEGFRT